MALGNLVPPWRYGNDAHQVGALVMLNAFGGLWKHIGRAWKASGDLEQFAVASVPLRVMEKSLAKKLRR